MEAEIGAIDLDAELAHARIEGVGRDRVRRLRRALEVDFTVAGDMRVGIGVALGQYGEAALARGEPRFRCIEILALPERNEVVDRSGIGGEVAGAIDAGKVDPADEGQRDALVAGLAVRAWIECRRRRLV